jgi:hypothetical protein
MSRTYKSGDIIFNYNSDFSGDVEVTNTQDQDGTVTLIPGAAILEFVTEAYIKAELISNIEQMGTEQLLNMITKKETK